MIKDGVDETAVEGAKDIPYAIPKSRVDWHLAPAGVPTFWWRSVGHSHTAFVVETLIDELAHAAGKDPLEFRRGLLDKHPRVKRVLEFAADKAGWGKPPPAGQGRGIAVHESFGSYVAHVAEVSVSERGQVRVHRVVCAIDCGPVVNPDYDPGSDGGRHGVRPHGGAVRRDHVREGPREAAELPRLSDCCA